MSQEQVELGVTPPPEDEKGKTPLSPPGETPPLGSEPPPGSETPPSEEVEEQTVDPEKLKQQLNTQTGLLKQAQQRLKELEKQHLDFGEVSTAITGITRQLQDQGETLTLVTDVLSQMSEGNEELQQKVEAQRKAREATQEQVAKAQTAYTDIMGTLQLVEIDPNSEEAKPVREAFNARDYPKAKELAKIAVQAKVSAIKLAPSAEEDKGEKEKVDAKGKQKVITKTPGTPPDWRDLSPKEKIKSGVAEAKANQ